MSAHNHHPPQRCILHIDMDAFYASVEQRDNPAYRGKPVVVGGSPEKRGAVAAASYEARQFGIHSAMSSRLARRRCPELIFLKPRFEVYREVSEQIREIFHRYTDLVEPLSLDEAYLDVTASQPNMEAAMAIALDIKQHILTETQLTASAGVSINKFLAKVASATHKPDGLYVIPPHEAEKFVERLPIEKFHGIGGVTAMKMHHLGIHTGKDLKGRSQAELIRHFGKVGRFYYNIARARDDRPVNPHRIRKSIGAERTFEQDFDDLNVLCGELEQIANKVAERLEEQQRYGHTITLKIKYADYQQVTRSRTASDRLYEAKGIFSLARDLLLSNWNYGKKVRLLGISISNLHGLEEQADYVQLNLGI